MVVGVLSSTPLVGCHLRLEPNTASVLFHPSFRGGLSGRLALPGVSTCCLPVCLPTRPPPSFSQPLRPKKRCWAGLVFLHRQPANPPFITHLPFARRAQVEALFIPYFWPAISPVILDTSSSCINVPVPFPCQPSPSFSSASPSAFPRRRDSLHRLCQQQRRIVCGCSIMPPLLRDGAITPQLITIATHRPTVLNPTSSVS